MKILSKNTALIPQPRTVDTFPSGLVRVTQTYIGRTALKATHRALLAEGNAMPDGNSSPCLDGLKIFPEAQERARDDGMTEYIVTAYGRVNSTGKKTFAQELSSYRSSYKVKEFIWNIETQNEEENYYIQSVSAPATVDKLIWLFCVPKNEQLSIVPTITPNVYNYDGTKRESLSLLAPLIGAPVDVYHDPAQATIGYFHEGTKKSPQSVVRQISKSFFVSSIEKSNFGDFDEWTVTYTQPIPEFNFTDLGGYWIAARISPFSSIANLLPYNETVENETLGAVWNLDSSSSNYVQLTESFQTTETGRAKIQLVGDTYSINNQFGYYTPGMGNIGVSFVPFSRPQGGTAFNGQIPPRIFQGPAEWVPSLASPASDSGGEYRNYVYNLVGSVLLARFRWTLSNEFGQTHSFTGAAEYRPDTLTP